MQTRHLAPSENPPDIWTQYLANTLPQWTAARRYGIPASLTSIPATYPAGTTISQTGSQWQRFVNTMAIELDTLSQALDDGILEYYLQTPGYTHKSLDIVYRNPMPDNTTAISAVWANLQVKSISQENYPSGPSNASNPNPGGAVLDPYRTTDLSLIPVTRLFDFVYGVSQVYTTQLSGTSFVLPNRVGINEDGSPQIEWITINGVQTTGYVLADDLQTITIGFSPPGVTSQTGNINQPTSTISPTGSGTITPGSSSYNVSVHFTTYDVYYVLQEDLPVLYLRSSYYEIMIASSGTIPPTVAPVLNASFPENTIAQFPILHMVWNELDEIGLYLNRTRRVNENNNFYLQRLLDSIYYPADATSTGLRNALATEFGLVNHHVWGPAGDYSASTIFLGSTIDPNSIQVNNLGLPYYSVSTTTNQTGLITLAVPALAIGQTTQVTCQFIASGSVIPRQVPYSFSTTLPASGTPIYDQITITRPKLRFTIEDVEQSSRDAWYPGSLCLWKNGVNLVSDIDFQELSTTVFVLTDLPNPGDTLQLGYIYENADDPPEIEAQSDILTDLAPIVRIGATFNVDATATTVFPGYLNLPPNVDAATIPSGATWTITFTCSNTGSAASPAFSILINCPPTITFDGTYLTSSDVSVNRNISYIDTNQVSINNLTDASYNTSLYNADGSGTALLHQIASIVRTQSPLEWGDIHWDTGIWHAADEPASEFGYIPNLFDPTYNLPNMPMVGAFASSVNAGATQTTVGNTGFQTYFIDSQTPLVNVDPTNPGNTVAETNLIRYPQFQSGIGAGDDLLLSLTPQSVLDTIVGLNQGSLTGTNQSISYPSTNDNEWWVSINPGGYFLNQEYHQLFSNPLTIEAYTIKTNINNYSEFSPIIAQAYSGSGTWIPLRRCAYLGSKELPSLKLTEQIAGIGQSTIYLNNGNLSNISILSGSDQVYTIPQSTTGNSISCSPPLTSGVNLTIQYTLNNSYMVEYSSTGAELTFDQAYPNGVIVTYEAGGNTNFVSGYPLHPYYNPKSRGFVYLKSCAQVPSTIGLHVSPHQCISGGLEEVTVYINLLDADGAGCEGYTVSVVVAYPTPVTYLLTTNMFGQAQQRIPSSVTAHLLNITASLVLYSNTGTVVATLLDQTKLQCFAPFT